MFALIPAALIGFFSVSCATNEAAGEKTALETASGPSSASGPSRPSPAPGPRSGAKNQTASPVLYSREARIPLWDEAPAGLESEKIPALSVSLDLLNPEALAGGTGKDLELLLRNVFYRGLSVQDYSREQIRVQTMEYRDMGEEARYNLGIINSATLNWNYEETFEVPVNGTQLLVISRSRAFYSGGAHPNYDKSYFVFDRDVGMRISLSDLVRKDAGPALKELINRELRLYKKIGPGDSLKQALFFVDEAEPTENCFLSPQGLGFHWDPYEIASYAEGYVEILIPYADIWELLGPEGRRLAREFGGN
jgi:hypothetical protein